MVLGGVSRKKKTGKKVRCSFSGVNCIAGFKLLHSHSYVEQNVI